MQELVRYWGTDYDWRKGEAKLDALPQFTTNIDGLDIHFIHIRSRHKNALPVIITHGWPGSVFELLRIIGPLTDPAAHGGGAGDAFDVVIPSLPGYGFSGKPTGTGWNPDRIARAWDELMRRLGYDQYVAQGGDWGAVVTEAMGRQAPARLLGVHVNLAATVPPDVEAAHGAARTKGKYFSSLYHRLAGRRGKKRAILAVGHSLLVTGYYLVTRQVDYHDLGPNYFDERNKEAVKRRAIQRLEQLGFHVQLKPTGQTAIK